MRYAFLILFTALSLASCGSYTSENSRKNTQFFFKDSTAMTGELLGVYGDSVYIVDTWSTARQTRAVHFSDLEMVVFLNEASPLLNGLGGIVGGMFAGGVAGMVLGEAIDGYRALPSTPVSLEHTGWGALGGLLYGVPVGALIGLIAGIDASTDKVVYVDEERDLRQLYQFARFRTPADWLMHRGY